MADDTSTSGGLDYDHLNSIPGNPREGEYYAIEQGNGGQWHIYKNGTKEFVENTPVASTDGGATAPSTPIVAAVPQSTGGQNTVESQSLAPPPTGGATALSTPIVAAVPQSTGGQNTVESQSLAPPPTGGATAPSTPIVAAVPQSTGGQNTVESQSLAPPPTGGTTVNGIGGAAAAGGGNPGSGTVGTPSDGGIVIHHSALPTPENTSAGGPNVGGGSSVLNTPTDNTSNTITVKTGDTLSGIAAAHGISLAQIEQLNPQLSANFNLIHPGAIVNLGGGAAPASLDSGAVAPSTGVIPPVHSTYPGISADKTLNEVGSAVETAGGQISEIPKDPLDIASTNSSQSKASKIISIFKK